MRPHYLPVDDFVVLHADHFYDDIYFEYRYSRGAGISNIIIY